jgi:hypothetical protein
MRNSGLIAFTVVVAIAFAIYVCGSVHIAGAPIFAHLDNRLGTSIFMTTYTKMVSLIQRKPAQEKEDMWTKTYQDFNKVLKNTSE